MRETYDEIMQRKNFYRENFRSLLTVVIVLLFISAILMGLILYYKMNENEPNFYATSPYGITKLKGMNQPNYSNRPLLKPDPPEEAGEKRLPLDL